MSDAVVRLSQLMKPSRSPAGLTAAEEAELALLEQDPEAVGTKLGNDSEFKPNEIVNEMPPEMKGVKGFLTRGGYKNFGSDSDESFNWVKQRHPDIDFTQDEDGDILAFSKADKKTYRLDPKGADWQDVTDSAYDLITGAGQSMAASAAGLSAGLGAGAATGGTMAVPAALGAASATSAALGAGAETARQKIGGYFGVHPKELDGNQVALSGVVGGVLPGIFGTGAGKQAIAKAATKSVEKGLVKNVGLNELESRIARSQGSPLFSTIVPNISALMSGQKTDVINRAKDVLPIIRKVEKNPEVYVQMVSKVNNAIVDSLHEETTQVGKGIGDAVTQMDSLGSAIPTRNIFQPLADLKEQILKKGKEKLTQSDEAVLAEIDSTMSNYFGEPKTIYTMVEGTPIPQQTYELPETITASQAQEFKHKLKDIATQYGFDISQAGSAKGGMAKKNAVIDSRIAGSFSKAQRNVSEELGKLANTMPEGFGQNYRDLNDNYSFLKETADELQKFTKDEESLDRLLGKASNKNFFAQKLLNKASEISGVDVANEALTLKAIKTFANAATDFQSIANTTSTSRTIPAALGAGALGFYIGQENDMSPYLTSAAAALVGSKAFSNAALRQYMMNREVAKKLIPKAGKAVNEAMIPKALQPTVENAAGKTLDFMPYMYMKSEQNER